MGVPSAAAGKNKLVTPLCRQGYEYIFPLVSRTPMGVPSAAAGKNKLATPLRRQGYEYLFPLVFKGNLTAIHFRG